ncbi:MAG TPA: SCO family protein [Fibrobacteria bacterium]|nr:SCO family protein [Fibrobacteria bacterium]
MTTLTAFVPSIRTLSLGLLLILSVAVMRVSAYGGKAGSSGMDQGAGRGGESLPPILVNVGITEKLGNQLPLDAELVNETGETVTLGSFFKGKPVLLNFAYYRCPMLCNMVLKGMIGGLKKLSWTPGKEFEIVTIGIDPREGHELAAAKKQTHIDELGRPEAAAGWHFLTGKEEEVRRIADALGFTYVFNSANDDYAHAAGIFTASPKGKVSRYLYGVEYRTKEIRLALLDASEGKAISIGDKIVMFCYVYDTNAKGYVLFARNFMRGGGFLVVALLTLLLGWLWLKELRKGRKLETASAAMRT